MTVSDIFLIGIHMDYELAVLVRVPVEMHVFRISSIVIALYGHAGLCYMTGEAQPIMADP